MGAEEVGVGVEGVVAVEVEVAGHRSRSRRSRRIKPKDQMHSSKIRKLAHSSIELNAYSSRFLPR